MFIYYVNKQGEVVTQPPEVCEDWREGFKELPQPYDRDDRDET